jgi:2-deoxy-D-gluconate 3-dehydrogenase
LNKRGDTMKSLNELLDLTNKTAIVTGGAKGIGWGISYRLAEAGAKVLIADMDDVSANAAAEDLRSKGWAVEAIKIDVSSDEEIKRMIYECRDRYGTLDILVNNAGIYPTAPLEQLSDELFMKVIRVNLRSVFLSTKYAAEIMKPQGGGKIINISSIDSLHPSAIGLAHYDASKHGVWGFTQSSALELAPYNIWVNAIAPGGISTPGATSTSSDIPAEQIEAQTQAFLAKIPMHRIGEPDDIGLVALFLASAMSSYMTGEQVVVDGGVLLS